MKPRFKNITILLAFAVICSSLYAQQGLHTRSNRALKAYNKGQNAYDFVKYDEAVTHFNEAVKLDKNFIEAHLMLSEIHRERKEYQKSIRSYNEVMRIDSLFYLPAFYGLAEMEFSRPAGAHAQR